MDEFPQETDDTKVVQFYLATGHQRSPPTDYYILGAVVSHISKHETHIVVVIRNRQKRVLFSYHGIPSMTLIP